MRKYVLKLEHDGAEYARVVPAKDEKDAVNRVNDNETLIAVTPYQGKSEVQMHI